MKKLISIVVFITLVIAQLNCSTPQFEGFNLGLQFGTNTVTGTSKTNTAFYPTGSKKYHSMIGVHSLVGGMYIDHWKNIISNIYVGAGFYVNSNFHDKDNKIFAVKELEITGKNKLNYGVKAYLGFTPLDRFMIFLGLGLNGSRWQLQCKNLETIRGRRLEHISKHENVTDFNFLTSIGMQILLDNIILRMEYTNVSNIIKKIKNQIQESKYLDSSANINHHCLFISVGYKL